MCEEIDLAPVRRNYAHMALHLIKLCVGCESPEQLEGWIEDRLALRRQLGESVEQIHTTRMVPRRMEELEGGSL